MLYYLTSPGQSIEEFLAENGEYIGILGSKTEKNITPADISIEKINKHLKEKKFLICCILNGSWWNAVIFNSSEGASEIKTKYKGRIMLWYWLDFKYIEFCLHHIELKMFKNEFNL